MTILFLYPKAKTTFLPIIPLPRITPELPYLSQLRIWIFFLSSVDWKYGLTQGNAIQ